MRTIDYLAAGFAALIFCVYGCSSSATNEPAAPSPADQTGVDDTHADHGEHADHGAGGQSDMEKMKTELEKLSPEDAASAERQHVCPVSGKMLGTMGPPQKIDVNGQPVWICCEHCKDELLANPDKYLTKLKGAN